MENGIFSSWLLSEDKTKMVITKPEGEFPDVITPPAENEPSEEDKEGSEAPDADDDTVQTAKDEIIDALEDLTDDEIEALLDVIYLIVLSDEENKTPSEDDKDTIDTEVVPEPEPTFSEAMIQHLTGAERSEGKLMRRTPKWKRKAKIRYIKNKKCPAGTTWSTKNRSCTRIDLDMSRLQKILAKMKIKN
jgi:hypothetical protein